MLLIILPIKNEQNIVQTAKNILEWMDANWGNEYEILFIDDGSTDDTYHRAVNVSERVKVIRNKFDNGKGSAIKAGLILSEHIYKLHDNDLIAFMDGDGQINPAEIKTFLGLMELYNADVVIGNKRHKYSTTKYSRARTYISRGFNTIVRKLFGINFEDTQCGLKIFRKGCLDDVISKVNAKRYAFDLELLVALREKHYRIIDAPVNIKAQLNQGSVSVDSILHTFLDTLAIWFRKMKGYYV